MADTRLSDLSAAGALSASDLFYVVQTPGSGGAKATGTQLLTLVGTTYLAKAGGTMTGALAIASGTLTASAPALAITQTWNNAGVAFDAIDVDVTNLASDFSSILQSWKVNGATKAAVYSYGRIYGTEFHINTAAVLGLHTLTINGSSTECVSYSYTSIGDRGVALRHVAFCNPADGALWSDLIGDSANALALRNGTNAQTLRVYGTADGSPGSNYQRASLSANGTTGITLAAEGLGTPGANQNITLKAGGTGSITFNLNGSDSAYFDYIGNLVLKALYSTSLYLPSTALSGWTSGSLGASIDIALMRNAAGVVEVTNGTANTYRDLKLRNLLAGGGNGSYVQTPSMTVDRLADAATAGAGARAFVTDANATTFLSTVAGGGSNKVPVVSNGTNWLIG